jgi:hypothetical protein
MDPLARHRHLFLIAALAAGCGGQKLATVGVSPPRAPEHGGEIADSAPPEPPPPVARDFRVHMTRLTDRFLSHGHADRFDATIWASEVVAADGGAEGDFADGTVFVEEGVVRDTRGDRSAGLLVMTKENGTFRFDAVDPEGRTASRERVATCVICHGEAQGLVFPWTPLAPR